MISAEELRKKVLNPDQIKELNEQRLYEQFFTDLEKNLLILAEHGKTQFPESINIKSSEENINKILKRLETLNYDLDVKLTEIEGTGSVDALIMLGWGKSGLETFNNEEKDNGDD